MKSMCNQTEVPVWENMAQLYSIRAIASTFRLSEVNDIIFLSKIKLHAHVIAKLGVQMQTLPRKTSIFLSLASHENI